MGYLVGGVLQYVLCALWVFPGGPADRHHRFAAFTFLSLVGLGITWATMAGLHDGLHLNYALTKVCSPGTGVRLELPEPQVLAIQAGVARMCDVIRISNSAWVKAYRPRCRTMPPRTLPELEISSDGLPVRTGDEVRPLERTTAAAQTHEQASKARSDGPCADPLSKE